VTDLLAITASDYRERVERVTRRGIAVWDVLKTCHRSGSLDSNIKDSSIVTNDFGEFFAQHPAVTRVFFNGAKAESVYRKYVLPSLRGKAGALELQRLPSTSPAHAGMSFEQKKSAWRTILGDGVE
jgi:hypoxanthine-DNA glycosylase